MEISQWQEGKNSFCIFKAVIRNKTLFLSDDLWYSSLFNIYVDLFLKAKFCINIACISAHSIPFGGII